MKILNRNYFYVRLRSIIDPLTSRRKFFKLKEMVESGSRHGVFIQIGAGAGDLDIRAGCKDGFSQLVKSVDHRLIAEIALVEPNLLNFSLLTKSWSNFEHVSFFQLAITPNSYGFKKCQIYWSHLDAPNFQTASINPNHVLKHFPTQEIEDLDVLETDCISLSKFLDQYNGCHIKLVGLDIEGIDDEVILETDFSKYDIDLISFEYIHMGEKLQDVKKHLELSGYRFVGFGVDVNNFDY